MNKILQITLLSGSLLISGALVSQNSKAKPVAGQKGNTTKKTGTTATNKVKAPGSMAPKVATLSDDQLSQKPVFTDLEEALKTPLVVYRLKIDGMAAIPPSISKMVNLQELIIESENQGAPSILPNELFKLTKLTKLKINGIRLGEVSEQLGQLTNLRYLDLTSCGITRLPENIGLCSDLVSIKLLYNDLPALPGGLVNMKKLKHLETSAMNLNAPENLESLVYQINTPMMSDGLRALSKLKSLKLMAFQKIDFNFGAMILKSMINLKTLDLTQTTIDMNDLTKVISLPIEELKIGTIRIFGNGGAPNPMAGAQQPDEMMGPEGASGPKRVSKISIKEIDYREESDLMGLIKMFTDLQNKESLTIPYSQSISMMAKEFRNLTLVLEERPNKPSAPQQMFNPMEFNNLKGIIFGRSNRVFPPYLEKNPNIISIDISKTDRGSTTLFAKGIKTLPKLSSLTMTEEQANEVLAAITTKPNIKEINIVEEEMPGMGMPGMGPRRVPRPKGQLPEPPKGMNKPGTPKPNTFDLASIKKNYPKAKITLAN